MKDYLKEEINEFIYYNGLYKIILDEKEAFIELQKEFEKISENFNYQNGLKSESFNDYINAKINNIENT